MKTIVLTLAISFFILCGLRATAEDGYQLWLRYAPIANTNLRSQYLQATRTIYIAQNSATSNAAKAELESSLKSLLGQSPRFVRDSSTATLIIAPTNAAISTEGFDIRSVNQRIRITGSSDIGLLYGVFDLLRSMQQELPLTAMNKRSEPRLKYRILNHWDNLNRSVERGYAGISIWDWHRLPNYQDKRYTDYARANASIGINGTVLTNVNANALALSPMYLAKVAALANIFRPYGIRVYLTARFSAPVELGGLKTADPLNEDVRKWWADKAAEIYKSIPDFGGFLVKANSEGQPGPQTYNRSHADGANMLAAAVAPFNGIVIWRAFVYNNETREDRFRQAYSEFKPLDGKFAKNVLLQVKNGPIDFQPREPAHPLFGAMPSTPLLMEVQLTQEYLGFATHLAYLPPMFNEVLPGALPSLSGIAAVANIGNERNWTGHHFGQANWYAIGRMAWDPGLSAEKIANEWIQQTLSRNKPTVETIQRIMLASHENLVNYMTPLGLHHIMGYGHHYGPAPWYNKAPREDWNPVYFHKADSIGIGFNRTASGSNAVSQYPPSIAQTYSDINSCPENMLLWFHHVPWTHQMKSGKTLWDELALHYQQGVDGARKMRKDWSSIESSVDPEYHHHVAMLLDIQVSEAIWWKDACLLYFQTFAQKPIPSGVEKPEHDLQYYQSLRFPYAPGNN